MRRIPHDELGRKRCCKCLEYKPTSEFSKSKRTWDGYTHKCKKCHSISKNPEWKELVAQHFKRGLHWCHDCKEWKSLDEFYYIHSLSKYDPYCKICSKARANRYRKATNYNQKYYAENTEKFRAKARLRPREGKLVQKQKRRAHIKGNGGSFTSQEWMSLKSKYGNCCLCCGRVEPGICLEPDHIIPISRGGINCIDNIQPLCHSCNAKKNSKVIDYRKAGVS